MKNQNRPEIITIEDQSFGSHVEHWNLLTENPTSDVPKWLGLALDAPVMPMGLCEKECDMDSSVWLIQGPNNSAVQLCQVIEVEDNKPRAVKTAFPSFDSPYTFNANVDRIVTCKSNTQAVLRLQLNPNSVIYAFDSLYSVNSEQYCKNQTYKVQLNAWAYELEKVSDHEQIVVDDPASIKHHRALNDILAEHNGVAPANLQELIDAWQPKSDDDTQPVTVDFSKMVAYLYGETVGQEDEAWFQGKVVGKTQMQFMDQEYTLYDVTLILEENQPAILIRVATKEEAHKHFEIGQYIRGNIWIQANIYAKTA
ncbi:hypothetical protein [Acinetobacter gerneri]|uniref:Uncharacterized protein n=2 Tax=Acinetobacter gerneri TaxID=202952 RepID=N8YBJ9_9GAMM|nr:hypothetical protein [Acinetobacter gerneri]ENV34137.1 hypothetical protein F960_01827 [Acinetobacter gerneri DSM 14967 = CIP 107464 = MTCC 9824]EPR83583.1 hypothetical protein L289_2117 [Acinetobacter gerneri DSM 14967 = CIP 107464 = MTCC 9824]MDQ9009446.1 hypothetical protein [Acinetobacter gerneri]MDQ9013551.1 hypothetical protein [Acinetobacter gerneri]MDQ9024885.1 hypothetical protein [Acinetobacter gerneri]